MTLPFRKQAGASGSGDTSHIGPMGRPGFEQGGAPGGKLPSSDLPMKEPALPMREGFSPEPSNPPLPTDPMDGYTKPPSGGRR